MITLMSIIQVIGIILIFTAVIILLQGESDSSFVCLNGEYESHVFPGVVILIIGLVLTISSYAYINSVSNKKFITKNCQPECKKVITSCTEDGEITSTEWNIIIKAYEAECVKNGLVPYEKINQ